MSDEPKKDEQKEQIESLSEENLSQVVGGTGAAQITTDETLNKAKTADKAYAQMDGYIKQ